MQEDIEACKESISLLENQRSKFATAEKFIQAADVVEQIKTHREKMRELELELAKHEKAESRSKKYHKEKQKKLAVQHALQITVVQKPLRAILGSPNNCLLLQILRVQLE